MIPRDLPGLSPREAWGPRPHHILRVGSERQWHHWIRRATTSPGSTLLLFGKGRSFILHAVTKQELFVHRGLRSTQRSVPGSMRAQRQKVGRGGCNSGTGEKHSGQRLIPLRDPAVWGSSFLTTTNQISQLAQGLGMETLCSAPVGLGRGCSVVTRGQTESLESRV